MEHMREEAYRVIKTVASPLRFFAVATLVLGGIIIVLVWKSNLPPEITVNLITIAFSALMLLLVIVAILVAFYPKKLVFDQEAHLTVLREKLGDSELPSMYNPGALENTDPSRVLENKGDGQ